MTTTEKVAQITSLPKEGTIVSYENSSLKYSPVLKIKKTNPNVITPSYATEGAACFDIHAYMPYHNDKFENVGSQVVIDTGLQFEIPQDHVMLIFSRSGHGFKHATRLSNCVGVIDSDYRGSVMVKLARDADNCPTLQVNHGDRIAQAMIIPVQQYSFDVVDDLSSTDRGQGGFGSTGA